MRRRGLANRLLQNHSEATTTCIFHAVIKEVELPAGTAIAVFRSPLPLEFVLASGTYGIKSADTHMPPVWRFVLMQRCYAYSRAEITHRRRTTSFLSETE
jgi:hypothetical protein